MAQPEALDLYEHGVTELSCFQRRCLILKFNKA